MLISFIFCLSVVALSIAVTSILFTFLLYKKKSENKKLALEILDLKKSKNEFEKNELRIRFAMQTANIVQWSYSRSSKRFISYKKADSDEFNILTSQDYENFVHPDDKLKLKHNFNMLDSGIDEPFSFEIRYKFIGSKEYQYFIINTIPFSYKPNGEVEKYIGFRREITRWKQINQNFLEYIEQDKIISSCLEEITYATDKYTLQKIVSKFATHFKNSTVSIIKFSKNDEREEYGIFEKLIEGDSSIQSFTSHVNKLPLCNLKNTIDILKRTAFIKSSYLPDSDNPSQLELNEYFKAYNVNAIMLHCIYLNGKPWGCVVVESKNSDCNYNASDSRIMPLFAHTIELYLRRRENDLEIDEIHKEKQLILNLLQMPVVLFDVRKNIRKLNVAAIKLSQKSEAAVINHKCSNFFCGKDNNCIADCSVQKAISTRKIQSRERVIGDKTYEITAIPFIEEGEVVKVLQSMQDITKINKDKQILREALDAAQSASKAKSLFLATMSHEIRTPLNAVIGFSELLQNSNINEKKRDEYLNSINVAGKALLHLINDVLDLSKLDSSEITLHTSKMSISNLLNDIEAIFVHRLQEHNVKFSLKCFSENIDLFLDEKRMRQILLNLVGNAVKFTDNGHITVSSEFEFNPDTKKTGKLIISVEDTGIGISPENQSKIFEPFEQADIMRGTRSESGTGLGLTIAKRLIENMGGRLILKSTLGVGSCFSFEIPNIEFQERLNKEKNSTNLDEIEIDLKNLSILLVDDVKLNLQVLDAILNKFGVKPSLLMVHQKLLKF